MNSLPSTDTILPVILGSDVNAYNVARCFHEVANIKSVTIGSGQLAAVKNSKIVDSIIVENFYDDDVLVSRLIEFAKENEKKDCFLFAASEHYVTRILRNYDELILYFHIPYTNGEMGLLLSDKEKAYELFEQYGLDYPKYRTVSKSDLPIQEAGFEFPLIVKPTESTDYFDLKFEGKEKAFLVKDIDSLNRILSNLYDANYPHPMFIQEYVHGNMDDEYVMNVYSNRQGKVTLMALGRIIVDDPNPDMKGNYLGIINVEEDDDVRDLYASVQRFLENVGYTGLSNFDFKRDSRTGKFKCFEINLRQGRSSYFSTVAGANFAQAIINDYVHDKDAFILGTQAFLWYFTDYQTLLDVLEKRNPGWLPIVETYKNKNGTMEYDQDRGLLRRRVLKKYFDTYNQFVKKFL